MTITSNVIELLDVIKLSKIPILFDLHNRYAWFVHFDWAAYMPILTNVPVLPDAPIWIYSHHDRFDSDDQYDQYGRYD